MAAGCSNTPSDRVSLLKLPSHAVLRRIWGKQVQRTLAQWNANKHSPFFVVTILLRTCFEGGWVQWKATKHSHFFVVTILLRICFEGGWAAMAVWDGGKGGCIPSTCCEVAAGGW